MDIPHNTRKGSGKSRIILITPRFNLNFLLVFFLENVSGGDLALGIKFFALTSHKTHIERIYKVSEHSVRASVGFEFSGETRIIEFFFSRDGSNQTLAAYAMTSGLIFCSDFYGIKFIWNAKFCGIRAIYFVFSRVQVFNQREPRKPRATRTLIG